MYHTNMSPTCTVSITCDVYTAYGLKLGHEEISTGDVHKNLAVFCSL